MICKFFCYWTTIIFSVNLIMLVPFPGDECDTTTLSAKRQDPEPTADGKFHLKYSSVINSDTTI